MQIPVPIMTSGKSASTRNEKLSAKLKENLKRRKAQARAMSEEKAGSGAGVVRSGKPLGKPKPKA